MLDTWTGVFDAFLSSYIKSLLVRRTLVGYTALLSIFGFVGLYLGLRTRFSDFLPLAFCLLIFPIPYYVTHSSLRYRHPIDPALAILVTLVFVRIVAIFRAPETRAMEQAERPRVVEEPQSVSA